MTGGSAVAFAAARRPYLVIEKVFHRRYHLAENRGGFRQAPRDEHAVIGAADLQDVRRDRPRDSAIPHLVSRPADQQHGAVARRSAATVGSSVSTGVSHSFGGIIAWEPLFMFVFLFGISMDYHVFLLSRIRELRLRGSSTKEAVVGGIASSAGVVTSAAFIMVAVFSVFATLSLIDLKILGVGMAAAVLIDATIVRGILLPAALALLGDRTWAAPRWLRRRAEITG